MGKGDSIFRFKKFECRHGSGSMKIGIDAVLLGAWADVSDASTILDVGTGCGVIALMCAQRNASARIDAIDVDPASVAEAAANFAASPWSARLNASLEDFVAKSLDNNKVEGPNKDCSSGYDLIISNPPYFHSGIFSPDTPRLSARHAAALSPETLLRHGAGLLSSIGRIAMVLPADQLGTLLDVAEASNLTLHRALQIQGHPNAPIKRLLLEFTPAQVGSPGCLTPPFNLRTLTLETAPGIPTETHRLLCRDFYLKF